MFFVIQLLAVGHGPLQMFRLLSVLFDKIVYKNPISRITRDRHIWNYFGLNQDQIGRLSFYEKSTSIVKNVIRSWSNRSTF
jgi:hypothetical protein